MAFVYLLANNPYGTLYIGSTFDLVRRVWEHKMKAIPGFTAKYSVGIAAAHPAGQSGPATA